MKKETISALGAITVCIIGHLVIMMHVYEYGKGAGLLLAEEYTDRNWHDGWKKGYKAGWAQCKEAKTLFMDRN